MQTFNEEQQSRREDSVVTINRLAEEHSEILSEIIDKQSQVSELLEEIRALETDKKNTLVKLAVAKSKHKLEFNETV